MPDSPSLQINSLGGVQVSLNGKPLGGFVSTKVQALLIYLAVTGRPQAREKLIGLLWADMPDADAKTNLRQALSNLRKLVPDHVSIERDTAAFNHDSLHLIDVECFETHLKADRLSAAIEVYRGDFLEGFVVRDAPEFEEWLLAHREHWRELALRALDTLAQRALHDGRYVDGIDAARRILSIDAWREEAHRQLMLLLARSGQFSAALAQYDTCRRVMRHEFNTDPAAETTALHERIRAALAGARGNLTEYVPPSALIGRARELAEVTRRLRDPHCRLLTLVGLGGSGKTRLALAAAQTLSPAFLNGAYCVLLTAAQTANDVAGAIGEALRYPLKGDPLKVLPAYLRQKELLLVLDNFEHLIAGEGCMELIAAMVKQAPEVKVLITSRESLNLQHEWLYEVKELPDPDALALFAHAAQRLTPDAAAGCDEGHVSRICRAVSNLPLGIELAAAWTRAMSCAEIAAELERRTTPLASPLRDAPARHRSLQAVFDHSWQLLAPDEQRALAALTVFRGGFTREAAQVVAGASAAMLVGLVNQSLVQRLPSGRFDLHELVRQYAEVKAVEIGAVRDRHCAYFADFLAAHEPWLRSERQSTVFAEIRAEIDNVRVMWRCAVEQRDAAVFARALMSFFWIYDMHGQPTEAAELLAAAAACLEEDRTHAELYSQLLTRQVTFLTMLSEFERAEALCQRAMSLSREAGDLSNQAFAVRYLGYFAMVRGDLLESKALMLRCLELYQSLDNVPGICDALTSLALVLNNLGEYEAARQNLLEAADRAAAIHDEISRSVALSNLGGNAYYTGQFEEARRYYQASYDIDHAHDDRRRMAVNLHNLACVACDLHDWSVALQIQQDALALFTDVAQQEGVMHCRQNLARIRLGLNDLPEVRRHLHEAFVIGGQIGAVRDSLEICAIGAELLRRESQFDRAARVIGRLLHHSAATAAVKEDARAVLARLEGNCAAIVEAQPENTPVAEIIALIRG
jgi:DNA-binding SARP family transcriptional activator/predicted ATPase